MTANSKLTSRACERCGRHGWLLSMERFLSATCMGWCLKASFEEHPKSMMLAYAGGVSSVYLAIFSLKCLVSELQPTRLKRAGGFLSAIGTSWGLQTAFDEHPDTAMKACVAGALSFCLVKSVILSDPPTTSNERPFEAEAISGQPSVAEVIYSCANIPLSMQTEIEFIGKELSKISRDFCETNLILTDQILMGKYLPGRFLMGIKKLIPSLRGKSGDRTSGNRETRRSFS